MPADLGDKDTRGREAGSFVEMLCRSGRKSRFFERLAANHSRVNGV
jgi:hypothetical protein